MLRVLRTLCREDFENTQEIITLPTVSWIDKIGEDPLTILKCQFRYDSRFRVLLSTKYFKNFDRIAVIFGRHFTNDTAIRYILGIEKRIEI